jgi:hypothetical protein
MSGENGQGPVTVREINPLIRQVEELLRGRETAPEDVPLLTEIADTGSPAAGTPLAEGALAADLERALLARLAPDLDRRLAVLRAELEKELRRAVREAVAAVLAARAPNPRDRSRP